MGASELRGFWWLPERPDDKVAGILTFPAEESIRLELIGALKDLPDLVNSQSPEVVLGIADGKLVTLVDCIESRISLSLPGCMSQSFVAAMALVGAHFDSTEKMMFNRVDVQYPLLADWAGVSGITPKYRFEGKCVRGCEVNYEWPEEQIVPLKEGTLRITYGVQTGGDLLREFKVRHSTLMRFDCTLPKSFEELYREIVCPMQYFLCLATGESNYPTSLTVYSPLHTIELPQREREPIPIEVRWSGMHAGEYQSERIHSDSMRFQLKDVKAQCARLISRWFELSHELGEILGLFYNTLHTPHMYLEYEFLSVMQALEAYHRFRKNNCENPPEEHEKRLDEILKAVPEPHKCWLKEKLAFSNEPSLHKRLRELLDNHYLVMADLVGSTDDSINRFVTRVKDTRNYLIHHNDRLRNKVLTGAQLFSATRVLIFLFEACLLEDLGFSEESINRMFRPSPRYQHEVRRSRNLTS